ncbi:unnamed protein product [Durusdinium trenchii]|uniref:Methyltransferase domain-containing protein n=1 Tax=Durusdinium trenchii TaxID=1381693 RepID=A0ABP0JJT2_9DINO
MVLELLKNLQQCAVYTDTPNFETNRKLWNAYAQSWATDAEWVQRMSKDVSKPSAELAFVGDEWSDAESLTEVLKEWLFPHLATTQTVAEIGSGGGRVAAQVAEKVGRLVCFDISETMLKTAQKKLQEMHGNVDFHLLQGDAPYPARFHETFDVVYSFDVFVHMDLHEMRHTLTCIQSILRPGGLLFVSFANLLAPEGWRRFARQKHYSEVPLATHRLPRAGELHTAEGEHLPLSGSAGLGAEGVTQRVTQRRNNRGFDVQEDWRKGSGVKVIQPAVPVQEPVKPLEEHIRWLEELRGKLQGELKTRSEEEWATQVDTPSVPEPFRSPALL